MVRRHRNFKNWKQLTTWMHLPIHQKRRNETPTPHLRLSDSIFLISIRWQFDWCIIQVKHWVRRHRKIKERWQITRMKHSPCHQKRRHGTPTPHLRLSNSIFLIFIRCLFDWCIIQVKHLVRRHRKNKNEKQLTIWMHLPIHQNRRNGTPTPHLRLSDSIFLIGVWCLFDWCIIQVKHLVRRHRKIKIDDNWPESITHLIPKNAETERPRLIYAYPIACNISEPLMNESIWLLEVSSEYSPV